MAMDQKNEKDRQGKRKAGRSGAFTLRSPSVSPRSASPLGAHTTRFRASWSGEQRRFRRFLHGVFVLRRSGRRPRRRRMIRRTRFPAATAQGTASSVQVETEEPAAAPAEQEAEDTEQADAPAGEDAAESSAAETAAQPEYTVSVGTRGRLKAKRSARLFGGPGLFRDNARLPRTHGRRLRGGARRDREGRRERPRQRDVYGHAAREYNCYRARRV